MNDSRVIENYNINSSLPNSPLQNLSSHDVDSENSSNDGGKQIEVVNEKLLKKSASDAIINESRQENESAIVHQLSKSLGATDINCVTSEDDEPFSDARAEIQPGDTADYSKNVFVSAAMSIDYASCPPLTKYIRGDNIVSAWAMRPVSPASTENKDSCIFEWLLCIDLKGSLPKYVLNTAFIALMTDYMQHLR